MEISNVRDVNCTKYFAFLILKSHKQLMDKNVHFTIQDLQKCLNPCTYICIEAVLMSFITFHVF